MAKRVDVYRALREKGMTYEEIGEIFGVTRQAVHDAVSKNRDGFRESTVLRVQYVGLRDWMLTNRVGLCELADRCNIDRSVIGTNLIRKNNMRKSTIDAILRVTGLTYEECFKEDDPE
jgi:predicted DNA-binding protein YlxM (UPF0122 family)